METTRPVKYGIGEQDFKSLRERGCVYVDKTRFIERIINSGSKYYFLARPRRFGKSLFLSTLRYFFEGERSLFENLHIDSIGWDWRKYPVLRLDLNIEKYGEPGILDKVLSNIFSEWEEKYGISQKVDNISSRFSNIIKGAHEKTGCQVVILVDEYDKPLVGNLNKEHNFEYYREKLATLYSNFKSSAEHIRLVFLSGVSRFSKLSIFSDLNNLTDISFSNEYADICGVTESELRRYFTTGIGKLAAKEGQSFEEAVKSLKENYDGYRFAEEGSDIYNPCSLLNCLDSSIIANYWNETGFPSLIVELLKRIDADLENSFDSFASKDDLMGMDLLNPDPIAIMYQTGYLTIKDYIRESREFHLGIPNKEVRKGLLNNLLPYYVNSRRSTPKRIVADMMRGFISGNPQEAMKNMQAYFAGIDYKLRIDDENNFHNAFFILTDLIGLDSSTEVSTSDGRIDIVIKTSRFIYIIELKFDHSALEAIRQIEEKKYGRPWQTDSRKIFLIGVNFSSKTRCIEDWIVKPYEVNE